MPDQEDNAVDSSDRSLHLESREAEPSPNDTSNIYAPQTRGRRIVKTPSKYRDFQL